MSEAAGVVYEPIGVILNGRGVAVVELLRREGPVVCPDGAGVLDGTPLLGVKPYTSRFDCIQTDRDGRQEEVDEQAARHRGRRFFRDRGTR